MLKTTIAATLMTLSFAAFAQAPTATQTDPNAKQAKLAADTSSVDAACSAEIAKGNCAGEKVGHGLMMCIHKANKGSISDGCKAAMKSAHGDMKAMHH